ncbi:Uncharacterized protein dnm_070000 [Desulfonema magnum]|uniref:Uncharacterized protein n=1 Tax=Desulfonema magnum TaxID=45655 RepID=A0A975BSQ4_9BACT|nr:Uncharacterized protein dnm_070000 [Desulfonema magnum]
MAEAPVQQFPVALQIVKGFLSSAICRANLGPTRSNSDAVFV